MSIRSGLKFGVKYLYVLIAGFSLLIFGIFSRKQRAYIQTLADQFGWKKNARAYPTPLPLFDPDLMLGGTEINILQPEGNPGNVTLLELVILNALVKKSKAGHIFEFGTFDGRTTLNMAANSGPTTRIYTLDLPAESAASFAATHDADDAKFAGKIQTGYKYKKTRFNEKIVSLEGDSSTYDYGPYRKSMDFIFIDGGHSLFFVENDTKNALSMIRDGGTIAWHDYRSNCEGVTKVVNELYEKGGIYGNLRRVKGTNLAVLTPHTVDTILGM